jgi:hypothetical protein
MLFITYCPYLVNIKNLQVVRGRGQVMEGVISLPAWFAAYNPTTGGRL